MDLTSGVKRAYDIFKHKPATPLYKLKEMAGCNEESARKAVRHYYDNYMDERRRERIADTYMHYAVQKEYPRRTASKKTASRHRISETLVTMAAREFKLPSLEKKPDEPVETWKDWAHKHARNPLYGRFR